MRRFAEHTIPFIAALASINLADLNQAGAFLLTLTGLGFTLHRWHLMARAKSEKSRRRLDD